MHQRATFEGQQRLRLARQRVFNRAVVAVLALGVFYALLELAFQRQCGGGDAVDEQHQIEARVVTPPHGNTASKTPPAQRAGGCTGSA